MKHEIIKKLKTNSRTFETGKLMWNAEKEDVEISKIYPVKETIYGSGYAVYDREYKVLFYRDWETDRKSTRLNSSHSGE